MPVLTTTSSPPFFSISIPSLERLSLTSTFILCRLRFCLFLHQYLFRRGHALAHLDLDAEFLEAHLDAGYGGYDVERIGIAKVRYPAYLALQVVLAARDGYAVLLPHELYELARVQSFRRLYGRQRL